MKVKVPSPVVGVRAVQLNRWAATMRITLVTMGALALAGFADPPDEAEPKVVAPYGQGIDYTNSARQVQTVDFGDATAVTIRCYCQAHRVHTDHRARSLTLDIEGTFSISGYHGSAEDAGVGPIPPKGLHFLSRREGPVIVLESPEWQYLHHSFLVDTVVVTSPIPVHFEHLTYKQLYDRKAERSSSRSSLNTSLEQARE